MHESSHINYKGKLALVSIRLNIKWSLEGVKQKLEFSEFSMKKSST